MSSKQCLQVVDVCTKQCLQVVDVFSKHCLQVVNVCTEQNLQVVGKWGGSGDMDVHGGLIGGFR